jgi:hypothetical protein
MRSFAVAQDDNVLHGIKEGGRKAAKPPFFPSPLLAQFLCHPDRWEGSHVSCHPRREGSLSHSTNCHTERSEGSRE